MSNVEGKMYKPRELSKLLNVSTECLRKWNTEGKLQSTITEGGHRRYLYSKPEVNQRKSFIYARVSSSKQKFAKREDRSLAAGRDLQRQIDYLQEKFPSHEVISDIGSGLNFKRKGFVKLLECLLNGGIKEVVVAHKDRLCRFGYDLIEHLFKRSGSILTIIESDEIKDPINEFADDVLSIITVFTARYYGSNNILSKNKDISINGTDNIVQQVRRRKPILLQPSKQFHKIKVSRSFRFAKTRPKEGDKKSQQCCNKKTNEVQS